MYFLIVKVEIKKAPYSDKIKKILLIESKKMNLPCVIFSTHCFSDTSVFILISRPIPEFLFLQFNSLAMEMAAIVPSDTAVVICRYFLLITSPTA